MAPRKLLVVWNPFAGGKGKQIVAALEKELKQQSIAFQTIDTRETKDASAAVEAHMDASMTDLIIVGGDGTINEAVNGLKFNVPVSILPAGTGDDFVKNITIGKRLDEQLETAIHGKVVEVDLGQCNDRKFVNGVGIGFDGQIVEDMDTKRVPLLRGHAAYYYHVLRILGGYQERNFAYTVDGKEYDKELILLTVGNGTTFGGGFKLMPDAKIDDGLLEVCEIGKVSGIRRFLNIHKLSGGTHGSLKEVAFHKAKRIVVERNERLFAHIDGERMGQPPFDIKVLPKALKLRISSS